MTFSIRSASEVIRYPHISGCVPIQIIFCNKRAIKVITRMASDALYKAQYEQCGHFNTCDKFSGFPECLNNKSEHQKII